MSDPKRVLVVDDDPGVRSYLESTFQSMGYRVVAVTGGEQAIAELDQLQPDLVTLDVALPGMDGLSTLRSLKSRDPGLPVIMLSGNVKTTTVVAAIKAGAEDFLEKPFEHEDLQAAARLALGTRRTRR